MKVKQTPNYVMIMFLITILLIISIFSLIYFEFKYNLSYFTSLDCKAPSFITNSKQDSDFKQNLQSLYIGKCSGYSESNSFYNSDEQLNEYIHGHRVALDEVFSDSLNLKNLLLTDKTDNPIRKDAISESLWLATVEIRNKCDPQKSPPLRSCVDLINNMTTNTSLKLYPENRLAYLNDGFSEKSDFIKNLGEHMGLKLSQKKCGTNTGLHYLDDSKKTPKAMTCDRKHSQKKAFGKHENSDQYYPILIKE